MTVIEKVRIAKNAHQVAQRAMRAYQCRIESVQIHQNRKSWGNLRTRVKKWWLLSIGTKMVDFMERGRPITAEEYCKKLTKVRAIQNRRGKTSSNLIFLHIACAHTAAFTKKNIQVFHWKPPYSPSKTERMPKCVYNVANDCNIFSLVI